MANDTRTSLESYTPVREDLASRESYWREREVCGGISADSGAEERVKSLEGFLESFES